MYELIGSGTAAVFMIGAATGAALAWAVTTVAAAARRRAADERVARCGVAAREAAVLLHAERERREEAEAQASRERDRAVALTHDLAVAEERAEQLGRRAHEQDEFLERSREQLERSFGALAATALEASNRRFLELAEQRLAAAQGVAQIDLDARHKEFETLLDPLRETLSRLSAHTAGIERARIDAYARLDEQIQALQSVAGNLGEKATALATALRGTRTRGRWGEMALRNVVEVAGMSEHCDFEEQATTSAGGRPDLTVRLPGGRFIAVDAKAPLDAYLDACDAATDAARTSALDRHVTALRSHVRELAARDYARALGGDVDLVVLFLPGEPFLGAAFAHAPELQVEALRSRVLVATPATLVALLRTVAIYWQQREIADNAREIAAVARELYDRGAAFGAHLTKVGAGLRQAVAAYDRAAGSFASRLLPMGRRLEELRVTETSRRVLAEPPLVDAIPHI